MSLDERLDPRYVDPDTEWEVDGVSSRRYLHGKYKYRVTYKNSDEESPLRPRDHEDFNGCQELLAQFDAKYPFGSLPYDKPEDQRVYQARGHDEDLSEGWGQHVFCDKRMQVAPKTRLLEQVMPAREIASQVRVDANGQSIWTVEVQSWLELKGAHDISGDLLYLGFVMLC